MKLTKIVATIGPASEELKTIKTLITQGVNVFRLNFSHGKHTWLKKIINNIRGTSYALNIPIAILGDLQGPKLRTGCLKKAPITLNNGNLFTLTTNSVKGDEHIVSISFKELPNEVSIGEYILLDDGKIRLKVVDKTTDEIKCKIINGGKLNEHKGINIPGQELNIPALTDKDLEDLKFCISQNIDYIALSFVRSPKDIEHIKNLLKEHKANIPVIAKIEKPQALKRIDAIIALSDGIMIARGDLGVEMKPEEVPLIQKKLIENAANAHKIVITATQMLESMISSPIPTRAEASDVSNAILDGTDAVMLSAETATGQFPIESVKFMTAISKKAETSKYMRKFNNIRDYTKINIELATASAACSAIAEADAKALIVFTMKGSSALLISKLHPSVPIIAFTPIQKTFQLMSLYRGVISKLIKTHNNPEALIQHGIEIVLNDKLLKHGDRAIVLFGSILKEGSTNVMKIISI